MAPSRSEGPYNERKNNMRMELKTKDKTKVEVLYKKGTYSEVFAIGIAYSNEHQNAKLIANIEKKEVAKLLALLSMIVNEP
tara:strand:+ start:1401 stop:1643 length:243 start_codon:yes stop_codon:yes gene_type:complete